MDQRWSSTDQFNTLGLGKCQTESLAYAEECWYEGLDFAGKDQVFRTVSRVNTQQFQELKL